MAACSIAATADSSSLSLGALMEMRPEYRSTPWPAVSSDSCWSTSWYSAVWEASSIWPILALWVASEMYSTFFFLMSRAAMSERRGV
jgi:hypothetical protein